MGTVIYHKNDAVPVEWFSKLENVISMTFGCDCEEIVRENGERVVERIGDLDDGSMINVVGNGEPMTVVAAVPTTFWNTKQKWPA